MRSSPESGLPAASGRFPREKDRQRRIPASSCQTCPIPGTYRVTSWQFQALYSNSTGIQQETPGSEDRGSLVNNSTGGGANYRVSLSQVLLPRVFILVGVVPVDLVNVDQDPAVDDVPQQPAALARRLGRLHQFQPVR